MSRSLCEFDARVKRVIDGDTFECFGRTAPDDYNRFHLRLKDIDTAERGEEMFTEHTEFAAGWIRRTEENKFGNGWSLPFRIAVYDIDSWGRWVATIDGLEGERDLTTRFLEHYGEKVRYDG